MAVKYLIKICLYFNSQPHEEADSCSVAEQSTSNISTHSLTKRLTFSTSTFSVNAGYFNSQPHEEADFFLRVSLKILSISTHSLTKRLTSIDKVPCNHRHISTHSLTKRLTVQVLYGSEDVTISTHSLTKRLTYATPQQIGAGAFQLTASRRG